ncbi:MAG: hypothetical protein COT45_03870 [bacterium (Candidatus Stahlbacteria) CG08_land_8_20_14_0_20_40_26]|nr:MAG: hypothetical protein COX49_09890 [bacterium (Candidatus Stahlbacteria) CG23_combo_of_CG06-09_8_20_14_all_40_9]PIS24688.1 MAG: hypothetical protein COT45_03870 [bacterium (Candidatus Stahlbacteria) CG08_land_8_20_14_0_20_40_26]
MWFLLLCAVFSSYDITIARVKYRGGDWYNDPSIIPNLAREINKRTTINADPNQRIITLDNPDLFSYPFVFLTGHGDIQLSDVEVECLREYLLKGGFLYADDDYGMNEAFRREMEKVFKGLELVELPFSHPIYHCFYDFSTGPPKIHEHDNKPPKGYGLFYNGRLIVYYTYESNISDGWADPDVHKDPEEIREKAFKAGINIVVYAMAY